MLRKTWISCLLSMLAFPLVADISWQFKPEDAPLGLQSMGTYDTMTTPGKSALFGAKFKLRSLILEAPSNQETNRVDDFAIETVFRADSVDFYRTILWKGDRTVFPQQIQYYLSVFNGKMEFKYKKANGDWVVHMTKNPIIIPRVWYHVIVRYKDGTPQFWVNGKRYLNAYETAPGTAPKHTAPKKLCANDKPLYIGAGHNGSNPDYHFEGIIREITIAAPANKLTVSYAKLKPILEQGGQVFRQEIKDKLLELERNIQTLPPNSFPKDTTKKLYALSWDFLRHLMQNDLEKATQAFAVYQKKAQPVFQKVTTKVNHQNDQKFFQENLKGKDFCLATMPTAQGYKRTTCLSKVATKATQITRSAAQGEVESFQLLLINGKKKGKVQFSCSQFTDANNRTLPQETTSWGIIEDITAHETLLGRTAHSPQYYIGSWPDLIRNGNPQTIPAKANQTIFIFVRFTVPADAQPGDYKASITLKSANTVQTLPVTLKVWPFRMPRKNSIPVVFSFFSGFYKHWYGLKTLSPQQTKQINTFLIDYRIPPNNIYSSNVYPTIQEQKEYDLNFATVGYFFKKKPITPKQLDDMIEKYRPRLKAVQDAGLQQNTYLYAFDEIVGMFPSEHHNTFAAANQIMTRFKKEFPWMKRLQTSAPHPKLMDAFDVWCPLFSYFDPGNPRPRKFRQQGLEFWWYAADSPNKPFPNFFLGYPLIDPRIIMTMTYQQKIKGILYWCVNREWSTNVSQKEKFYKNSNLWKPYIINVFSKTPVKRNGMGNFMYPAPDGTILPSIRLENFRDGVEDYELYVILEKKIAELKLSKNPAAKALLAKAEKTLDIPAEVAVDLTHYSEAPQPLMDHHDRVGDMIAEITVFLNGTK